LLGVTTIDTGLYPTASGELLTAVKVPVPIANPPIELAPWFATYTVFPVVPPPLVLVIGGKKPLQPVKTGSTITTAITTHHLCTLPRRTIPFEPLIPIFAAAGVQSVLKTNSIGVPL
jgi:hypothetical protein